MLNIKKKLEGDLISMGYNKEEREYYLEQLEEMFKFNSYIKEKYELEDDDSIVKMYELYYETRESEVEERIGENLDEMMDEDVIIDVMTESIVEVSADIMYDYAILHEYDKSDEYKKSVTVYVDKLMRKQIRKALEKNL